MSESVLFRQHNPLKKYLIICLAILAFVWPSKIFGATQYDPNYIWREIETDHFHIVFNKSDEELAAKVQSFIEDVYEIITDQLKYKPPFKTYIVIADNTDYVYGLSSSIQEKILISPTLPEPEILGTKFDNYLRLLLIHEFTHMVQMDMAGGPWPIGRLLFGKVASPNVFMPTWFLEGSAIYNETKFSSGGRGRDPLFNTIWRAAAKENNFKTLAQISSYNYSPWPGGNTPYYFGYPLVKYIADNYGETTIESISKIFSTGRSDGKLGSIFSFAPFDISNFLTVDINYAMQKTTGKTYKELYKMWQESAIKIVSSEAETTKYSSLTSTGVLHSYPKWLGNNFILFNASDFRRTPAIYQKNISSGQEKELIKNPYIYSSFDISRDSRYIVFSQQKNYKQFYTFSDIYLYDILSGKKRRVSEGQRLTHPVFSPDGNYIAAIQNLGGNNALVLLDVKFNTIKPILLFNDEVKMGSPCFSPDGKQISLSVGRDGSQNIYLVDIAGKNLLQLTKDNHSNINPIFSPDGKYILFNSDRSNIYNIYALSLTDKKLFKVTDLSITALYPSVSADKTKLAFCSYSTAGFDVCYTDYSPSKWQLLTSKNEPANKFLTTVKPLAAESKPYSPWASITPKIWSPYSYEDNSGQMLGAMIMGSDALDLHKYIAYLFYGAQDKRLSYLIQYINSQLYPDINLKLYDYPYSRNILDNNNNSYSYWEKDQRLELSATFPVRAEIFKDYLPAYQYISLGGKIDKITTLSNISPVLQQPSQGFLNSLFINYSFKDTEQYGFSISPENGRYATLQYEKTSKAFGADFNLDTIIGEGISYINLPLPNQIISLKLVGGVSRGDTLPQGKFALGGTSIKPVALENQYYALRGYDSGSIFGNKMLSGTLEYRIPLLYIENGFALIPAFFKRVSGIIFLDAGDAWTNSDYRLDFKTSYGAEITPSIIFLNWIPMNFTFGTVFANKDRKWSNYFKVGLGL